MSGLKAHIIRGHDPFRVRIVIGEDGGHGGSRRYRNWTLGNWGYITVERSDTELPAEVYLDLDPREAEALFDAVVNERPDVTSELRARLKVAEDRVDKLIDHALQKIERIR